jgi:hypothetical protein
MKSPSIILGTIDGGKAIPKVRDAQPASVVRVERFYAVERTSQVPRGASHYTLPAGKVISSRGYDIEELLRLGVPLKETSVEVTPVRARVSSVA